MSKLQYEFFSGAEANIIEAHKLEENNRFPWPIESQVQYVINEEKEVIARQGLILLPHIEGSWIREDYRNGLIAVRMIAKTENLLAENDRRAAFAFVQHSDVDIQNYMERLGYVELPFKVYVKDISDQKKKAG